MRTFAELLREYIDRAGISDAELARSLGVRRQTIFRWKEGLSERPRHREDVLRLAGRLRLTAGERDLLLLAGGFPPEQAGVAAGSGDGPEAKSIQAPAAAALGQDQGSGSWQAGPERQTDREAFPDGTSAQDEASDDAPLATLGTGSDRPPAAGGRRMQRWTWAAVGLLVVGLVAAGAFVLLRPRAYPVAGPGETLILIGQFTNYGGQAQGYNVAGRLQTAIDREIQAGRLDGLRVAAWPEQVRDEAGAMAAADRAGAAMVIWGEYDSGRVLCHFTAAKGVEGTELVNLLPSSADLPATINSTLPEEARQIALLTLGQLYIKERDIPRARAVLVQTLARPPRESDAAGALYFWLGYAYQAGPNADLDQAIGFYGQALDAVPNMTSALNNRAVAFWGRGSPGDLDRAIQDLGQLLAMAPQDTTAYRNRSLMYARRNSAGDLDRALGDAAATVRLAPGAEDGYLARAAIYLRQGNGPGWQADFQKALDLNPRSVTALNGLCWGYALDGRPQQALPFCDRAVAADPTPASRDSRGIAYAQLGRLQEASEDIRAFISWAAGQGAPIYGSYVDERKAWLAAFEAGKNPINETVLKKLRRE